MNTLRRKLQFQLIMRGGQFKVVKPLRDQEIGVEQPFDIEITNVKDSNKIYVYIGSNLIAELDVIEGTAIGTGVIKNEWVSGGSTYIVSEGSETPIGNKNIVTLLFTNEKDEVRTNVITDGVKLFNCGSISGSLSTDMSSSLNEFSFGSISGSLTGNNIN